MHMHARHYLSNQPWGWPSPSRVGSSSPSKLALTILAGGGRWPNTVGSPIDNWIRFRLGLGWTLSRSTTARIGLCVSYPIFEARMSHILLFLATLTGSEPLATPLAPLRWSSVECEAIVLISHTPMNRPWAPYIAIKTPFPNSFGSQFVQFPCITELSSKCHYVISKENICFSSSKKSNCDKWMRSLRIQNRYFLEVFIILKRNHSLHGY